MRNTKWLLAAALVVSAAACYSGRHSAAGFHLPEYGDAERGKAAFVALNCNQCHEVSGVDLSRPAVMPVGLRVRLGGERASLLTDGYLVTSIIEPSHVLGRYPKDEIADARGKSRMPEYADNMSVRQLTDIVAFLQSSYSVRQEPARTQLFD